MMPEARVAAPITTAEAENLALELYGIRATASALPGEYDDNFHLRDGRGPGWVLKVMHPAREASFVQMQCLALTHLRAKAPQLALPRVIPSKDDSQLLKRTIAGAERIVWMLSFVPGTVLAKASPRTAELHESLGNLLGQMDKALLDFDHPAAHRKLKWDPTDALWAREYLGHIVDPERRRIVEKFLALYECVAVPLFPKLRRSVIYCDANDHNALVGPPLPEPRRVVSVIDFGDMLHTVTIAEATIAAAYAILGQADPLATAAAVLAGYDKAFRVTEEEVAAFFPLMASRLAVSVVNSAHRRTLVPDDPYVTVSEAPAWEALQKLAAINPRFAEYRLRAACGFEPVPYAPAVRRYLQKAGEEAASVVPQDLKTEPCVVLDLGVSSLLLGADPANACAPKLTRIIDAAMTRAGVSVAVGRYDEARPLYNAPQFGGSQPTDERRTIHLGLDIFSPPGTHVRAPLDGTVHLLHDNTQRLDYGPLVILRHETDGGQEFFTLYGHLSRESLDRLSVGTRIAKGKVFAQFGNEKENGGWTPHLHFQVILDLLELGYDFPGVGYASQRETWISLCPDPNLLLGIPAHAFPPQESSAEQTLERRKEVLGGNLSVSYRHPLKIVRGWKQHLYDETGRAFLDVYNNVPLVGHSHPRVLRAVSEQLALLNTNTRYLHENVLHYAERLTALLPAALRICYFVNSGSEANELALRLARTHTQREDIIVLENAYHGHSNTLIDISPYKFSGPGGRGRKPWVHIAPVADDYRGRYRRGESDLGKKYADEVAGVIEAMKKEGRAPAAYIAETLPSVGGQIVFPEGYLAETYRHVRAAGGVCIADEVQVGFGRLGTHFWGFATQSVVPDIVVFGKPIGNAFPLAAVVTTPEIAASFANGMEFFSTFGGNPVACAAGLAVLDVVRDERLQENALRVGNEWMAMLRALQSKFPLIGDVRGSGLFLGIDLVTDRETRAPATAQASYVVNRLRDLGILAGTDGPFHNVIKLRPPLCFTTEDAALFTETLSAILAEDPAQPDAALT